MKKENDNKDASKNNPMIPIVIAVSCFMLLIVASVLILGSGNPKKEEVDDPQTEITKRNWMRIS